MNNILRQKLAEALNEAAHQGLARIDANSSLAKELKQIDVEMVLKYDIEKICHHVSFLEMVKIMPLIAQIKTKDNNHGPAKTRMKQIVKQLIDRIERDEGALKTPQSCRELLFNL